MNEPDAHWDEVEEAIEMLTVGERDEATAELERLRTTSPDNPLVHTYLGHAYFEAERFDESLVCYVRALALAPTFVAARVGAGQSLRFLGEHDKALRMAREALKVSPNDPDALYLAGCVAFQRGEKHAATQYLNRFLETGVEVEVALEVEGMLRVLRGDVVNAIDEEDESS